MTFDNKPAYNPADAIEVEDGENWNGLGATVGIQSIALEQFRRCSIEGSKVMDARQFDTWINCINSLSDVVFPFQNEEPELEKDIDAVDKQIKEIEDKLIIDLNEHLAKTGDGETIQRTFNAYQEVKQIKLFQLYRKKFRLLSVLFNKKDYFGEGSVSGGFT